MKDRNQFDKICEDIRTLRIQGATNIAIAAVKAYSLYPGNNSIKKLISLRPTEPALRNALKFIEKENNTKEALNHLKNARDKVAEYGSKLVKNNSLVYTHCHSSSVIEALVKAKDSGKKFEVYCTETRPSMQGRMTATDLANEEIKVTMFVDSAMRQAIKNADICLLGADAITADLKVINKIGSELAAETAENFKVPVYILTDSWKFDPKTLYGYEEKIEERSYKEVWKNPPKGVSIHNYAFEKIDHKLVKGIITEFGIVKPKEFIQLTLKNYLWMKERGD